MRRPKDHLTLEHMMARIAEEDGNAGAGAKLRAQTGAAAGGDAVVGPDA